MAIYKDTQLAEQPIYGSSRLGQYTGRPEPGKRIWQSKKYELSNHLGNVLAVVGDGYTTTSGDKEAWISSLQNYYPFGLAMEGRSSNLGDYRYGFNVKERDPATEWSQNSYDYGARIYNPGIGKFLSVDPLNNKYASYSPYNYAGNRPIDGIDVEGLSWIPVIDKNGKISGFTWTDAAPDPSNNIFALAVYVNDLGTYDLDSEFNMGSAQITVYGEKENDIFTFDGTSLPSRIEDYATTKEGLHTAELGFHNQSKPTRYLALRINNNKRTPVENDYNPSNGSSFATGVNAHKAGLNNKTGMTTTNNPISAACILVDRDRWNEFIGIFDNTSERENMRSVFNSLGDIFYGNPNFGDNLNPATYTTKENGVYVTYGSILPNPTIGFGIYRYNPIILKSPNQDSGLIGPTPPSELGFKFEFPERPKENENENENENN